VRVLRCLPLAAVLCAVTACSPGTTAIMGVTVDEKGGPVGVVAVCSGYVNEAGLMVWNEESARPAAAPVVSRDPGSWRTDAPVTDLGTWSLRDGTSWQVVDPLNLVDGIVYQLSGAGTHDIEADGANASSRAVDNGAAGAQFTLADLRRLEPGQVLYDSGTYVENSRAVSAVVPLSSFRSTVCGD
jgi:hypothetical protein